MRQKLALASIILLCLASCRKGKSGDTFFAEEDAADGDSIEAFAGDTLHLFEEVEPPATVDELFNDFFFEFAGDMRFQKQRVHFPLECADGDESQSLTRSQWAEVNRFAGHEFFAMIYEHEHDAELQKDTAVSRVSVDLVHMQDGTFDAYHFSRFDGLWVLTDVARSPLEQHSSGEFLQFYSRFMTDSIFQCESLAEPLRLIVTPQDEDEDVMQIEELDAEQWSMMRADLPFSDTQLISVDYGQQLEGSAHKTLSLEGFSNGFVMKLQFRKEDERWKLYEVEY